MFAGSCRYECLPQVVDRQIDEVLQAKGNLNVNCVLQVSSVTSTHLQQLSHLSPPFSEKDVSSTSGKKGKHSEISSHITLRWLKAAIKIRTIRGMSCPKIWYRVNLKGRLSTFKVPPFVAKTSGERNGAPNLISTCFYSFYLPSPLFIKRG